MRLYHYTCLEHLPKILAAGYLKLSDSAVHETRNDKSVVWLTLSEDLVQGWNQFQRMRNRYTGEELAAEKGDTEWRPEWDKTRIRITVDVPRSQVERWKDFARRRKVPLAWQKELIRRGGGPDHAKQWHVAGHIILQSDWLKIEDTETGEVLWERKHDHNN